MQHLEEGEIHAWLDGALPEAEGARIEQHVATCKECAAMVADARGLIAGAARIVSALDHVPSGVIPKSTRPAAGGNSLWRALRLTPFRAAMAASLVVAAGSLIVVQRKDRELMVPRGDAVPMAAAAAPAPTAPTTASAAPPPAASPRVMPLEEMKTSGRVAQPANEARVADQRADAKAEKDLAKASNFASRDTIRGLAQSAPAAAAPTSSVRAPIDSSAKAKVARTLLDSISVVTTSTVEPGRTAAGQGAAAQDRARANAADIIARRPMPPAVARLQESVAAPSDFAGCYQIADSTSWPRALPTSFSLVDDKVHLVRPGSDQRPVIGRWEPASVLSAVVILEGSRTTSFTIMKNGAELTAISASAPSTRTRVVRSTCAP
jgi:hypothetical protein